MDGNLKRKNREMLKGYFKKGDVPTESQFAELIDSMSNILEDGQVKITPNGWAFYPQHDGILELDLFKDFPKSSDDTNPAWRLRVTADKKLVICNEKNESVFEISQDKSVKYLGENEQKTVNDEDGYYTLPADKEWHNINIDLSKRDSKCRVFSIFISCCDNFNLCDLTHIIAIWKSNDETQIKSHRKHWWGWNGAVKFRWQDGLRLQICSRKTFVTDIKYRIVEIFKA